MCGNNEMGINKAAKQETINIKILDDLKCTRQKTNIKLKDMSLIVNSGGH